MIEKLSFIKSTINCLDRKGFVRNVAEGGIVNKVNEVVDAINELQEMYKSCDNQIGILAKHIAKLQHDNLEKANCQENVQDRMIGCTTLDIPESYKNDPYAEQREWIGCLVEYGNADDGFRYGILTNIEPRYSAYPFEIDNGRDATADCWLPSKTIFL